MLQTLKDLIPIEYLMVAAIVLAALFIITLVFRAMAGRSRTAESSRLGVSEHLDLDKHRRLVLLRRDDVEHLVLIGGDKDVVVESTIRPGVQRREEYPAAPRVTPGDRMGYEPEHAPPIARPQRPARPVPLRPGRPAVFGDHVPAAPQEPQERAEPRLEPLPPEDRSRDA